MNTALAVTLVWLAQAPSPFWRGLNPVIATVDRVDAAVLDEPMSYEVAGGRQTSRNVVVVTFSTLDISVFVESGYSSPPILLGNAECIPMVTPSRRGDRGVCLAPRPAAKQAPLWMASLGFELAYATAASLSKELARMTATEGRSLDVVMPDASKPTHFRTIHDLYDAYVPPKKK
jgi:hypothetical protein